MLQLKSILNDLENKAITKYQAYDLILVLFKVSKSVEHVREDTVCFRCNSKLVNGCCPNENCNQYYMY